MPHRRRFTAYDAVSPTSRETPSRASRTRSFRAPEHDHGRCSSDAIGHAEAMCAARGQRLTPLRRQVLETLRQPPALGAYDIMDRLAEHGRRPAPITVYRALDFLLEHGLVHRIESRNAFLACIGDHGEEAAGRTLFLICDHCGAVGEASSPAVAETCRRLPAPPASPRGAGDRDPRHLRPVPRRYGRRNPVLGDRSPALAGGIGRAGETDYATRCNILKGKCGVTHRRH